nr:MAG TPA: hypothetical protein [Bacteriophage sp.]
MGQLRKCCTNRTKPALIFCNAPSYCKYPTKTGIVLKLL